MAKYGSVINDRVVATIEGDTLIAPEGYIEIPAYVHAGFIKNADGTYGPDDHMLKTEYSHREFILRLGGHHAAIQRLRDENNLLPPSEKNYELERLFQLWERSQDINLNDSDLHAAFDAFVGMGLLTRAEADNILTPNEIL